MEQIHQIEAYLNFKELTQIDLRNEVLDHMSNGIEKSIKEKDLSFEEAFNQEGKKWNLELENYSSFWLGWAWSGPKLMIKKCVAQMKKTYFTTLIFTLLLMALSYSMITFFQFGKHLDIITKALGILYLGFFFSIVFAHLKIKFSKFTTSYSYLFKINAVGSAFFYLWFNPIWSKFSGFETAGTEMWVTLFFHMLLISFAYTYWDLYKLHFNANKLNLK